MQLKLFLNLCVCLFYFISSTCAFSAELSDPLPSWNDGVNKQSIIDFVQSVTDQTSNDYVPPEERIQNRFLLSVIPMEINKC